MDYFKDQGHFQGRWVVDSETGIQYLIDFKTGKTVATKNEKDEWVKPNE